MNIKCSFCQTPYTLSRVEMLDALQEMDAGKLTHYDAHCPRCRRATRVERKRMEMFFPNWRDALKQFEAEMKAHPQHEAPLPQHGPFDQTQGKAVAVAPAVSKPVPVAKTVSKAEHKPAARVEKKPAAKANPMKSTAKKPVKKKK